MSSISIKASSLEARVLRILAVAIFFVSSLQFFVYEPTSHQGHAKKAHDFYSVRTDEIANEVRTEGRAIPKTSSKILYSVRTNAIANEVRIVPDTNSESERNLAAEQSRQPPVVKNSTTDADSNSTKIQTGDYIPGEFCPYCIFTEEALCIERVHYMMGRYKIKEEIAKKNQLVLSKCVSPWMPHNIYAEEDEPSVILHVGPHKTGTTALQAFIYDMLFVNATMFTEDNLRIPTYDELPGVFGKEGVGLNLPHCMLDKYKASGGGLLSSMCHRMRVAFPKFMFDAYNKSQNVLIVAEDFDRAEIDYHRLRFYLRPYKKVKIVVMYRRLQDWLPSFYNQIVDHYTLIYGAGEEKYPSFVQWVEGKYDNFLAVHAMAVANRFRKYDYIESVEFLNMHEVVKKSNLVEYFFCDHLQTKSTCQAIKDGAKTSKSNIGTDHDYERLAIKAALDKKLPADMTRPVNIDRLTNKLKAKVEENNLHDKLQRECPNQDLLDQILQTEIEQEQSTFPEWFESQGGEEKLRQSFEVAVKKKFCSFDTDKIFESGMLDPIFAEMRGKCGNSTQGRIRC